MKTTKESRLKHASEMMYWCRQLLNEGGTLQNGWYQDLMLQIAGETDPSFVSGKVVADFGCGPRGSLCWASAARERIGIDVLADLYRLLGTEEHNIRYVQCSETSIPLETNSVDILYTVNALDHVDHLEVMCAELRRILKPGGELIGSFNLEEPASPCEPQSLTEEMLDSLLLKDFAVLGHRTAQKNWQGSTYLHFTDGSPAPTAGPRILWLRAKNLSRT